MNDHLLMRSAVFIELVSLRWKKRWESGSWLNRAYGESTATLTSGTYPNLGDNRKKGCKKNKG